MHNTGATFPFSFYNHRKVSMDIYHPVVYTATTAKSIYLQLISWCNNNHYQSRRTRQPLLFYWKRVVGYSIAVINKGYGIGIIVCKRADMYISG